MLPARHLRRLFTTDGFAIVKNSVLKNGKQANRGIHVKGRTFKIGVQSANFNKGQRREGADQGPGVIKKTGFIETLQEIGVDIEDRGNIEFPSVNDVNIEPKPGQPKIPAPLRNTNQVGSANKAISDATSKIMRDGRICLTLGGDHSIAIGTINGASEVHNDLAVLWVDAHADLNTPSTTWTGNFHGMPLSFLIEELQPHVERLENFSWIVPRIKAKNIAFIGLRDVDPYEREAIDALGILTYSMAECHSYGIEAVTELALEKITNGFTRPLHLSFDIDALDDLEAKSTGTPVPGGLTLREGVSLVERVSRSVNLVSMDMVEVNPLLGSSSDVIRTANAAKQIIINTFGYYRGGISTNGPLPMPSSSA